MNDDIDLDDVPESPFDNEKNKKRINSKKKGNRWELQVCKILGSAFDDEFRRVPMSGGFVGGRNKFRNYFVNENAQSQLTGDIITPEWFPFIIECKNYNDSPKIHNLLSIGDKDLDDWVRQAKDEAKTAKKDWLIIFNMTSKRKNFAVVDFDRFYAVLKDKEVVYPNNYFVYKGTLILDFEQFVKKFITFYFPSDWEKTRDENRKKKELELLTNTDVKIEPDSL
jgi:hypothetical protein